MSEFDVVTYRLVSHREVGAFEEQGWRVCVDKDGLPALSRSNHGRHARLMWREGGKAETIAGFRESVTVIVNVKAAGS